MEQKTRNLLPIFTFFLVLVGLGFLIGKEVYSWNQERNIIDKTKYQTVVLSGRDLYFGKVRFTENYLVIDEAFNMVTGEDEGLPEGKYAIKRLSGNIHQPENRIVIPLREVGYIEDLNPNGKVAQALKEASDKNLDRVEFDL
ncbi:hypothetical protein COT51_01510 [candidate division WWE3 bacterium CG08_land_8_20_14_0_20_41_15]|uniref:Uncharacterized protein n=1 Tax=candidate division WWE3 bacterium CG08_land_8_20_14_0_20_41_15 TaxID=1975086 RepID=A0A2H0XA00_UNCKA|nr:MAG: hypothetical protein COT51_01510 [candidate division WWE3 bacterium CG08_land_8_20_14_0_20_41_15]